MKIAGMVVWALTAGIGMYLLAVGLAAQRARRPVPVTEETLPREETVVMGTAAVLGGVLAGTDTAVAGSRPAVEGSPLLEFTHPALALTGLTFWIFYTVSDDKLFAWIGFGVVLAAVLAGISWVFMSRKAASRQAADVAEGAGRTGFPGHLMLLHGAAAVCTLVLCAVCLFAVVRL